MMPIKQHVATATGKIYLWHWSPTMYLENNNTEFQYFSLRFISIKVDTWLTCLLIL